MSALATHREAPANLTIDKEGAGRLYFRIGTKYAPANLKLAAADYGFRVERKYEAIDDPADVRREADGTWHIKAGARVRVRSRCRIRRGAITSRSSIRCRRDSKP